MSLGSADSEISLSELPDTNYWDVKYVSDRPVHAPGCFAQVELDTEEPGPYLLRITAVDDQHNVATHDRVIEIAQRPDFSPSVATTYPPWGSFDIPCNAPIVIKFDEDMNQTAVDLETFNLVDTYGRRYRRSLYDYSSRTLTLEPQATLEPSTFHYGAVDADFPNSRGWGQPTDYLVAFETASSHPLGHIESIEPVRSATGVGLDSPISVRLKEDDAYLYFQIVSLQGDTVEFDSITYDDSRFVWTLYPNLLLPRAYYIVRVSDYSQFGRPDDYMSYFITRDTEIPVVINVSPADNEWLVAVDQPVMAAFNKPMNVFSIDSASMLVIGPDGPVQGVIEFSGEGNTVATFSPSQQYARGTRHTVVLTSHIQDNTGNRIDSLSWSFTTGSFDTVGYDGNTLTTGDITLTFPIGSLSSDRQVGIGSIPPGKLSIDPTLTFTGLAFDIQPDIKLERKAVLSVRVVDSIFSEYGPIDRLKLRIYDSLLGEWVYLGGTSSGNTVSLAVPQLGRYGLFQTDVAATAVDFASSLEVIPRVISPRTGTLADQLSVSYKIAEPAKVTAKIYDTRGRLIKTLVDGQTSSVGGNLLTWDGRGDGGEYANDGLYILVIEAQGKKTEKTFVVLNR